MQPFTWAIISQELSHNAGNSISKDDNFYADWRVGQGGAGGATSTIQAFTTINGCGTVTYTQSDNEHFQSWVGTLTNGTDDVPRTLTGYYDGSPAGWGNAWGRGCSNTFSGTIETERNVYIGAPSYSGDIMEVIVWKGVALKSVRAPCAS